MEVNYLSRLRRELLKEKDQTEEQVKENGKGFDLVAQTDGTIVSIVTRSGVPLVQEGQEVKKGDTLVQGAIPILSGGWNGTQV